MKSKTSRKDNLEAARQEALAVMRRLEEEPNHVLQVATLALQIFDELADWHRLGARDRVLLEAAACLHDVGWSVARDGVKHHKHSARLIRRQTWQHFTLDEINLVAQIARYHRKSPPKPKHRSFAALSAESQRKVQMLAALLRVADALDRRHLQIVRRVYAHMRDHALIFEVDASRPLSLEVAAGHKKGDLLRQITRRELVFRWTGADKAARARN